MAMRQSWITLFILIFPFASNNETQTQEKVTMEGLLKEMVDLHRLTVPAPEGLTCKQFSSYDRKSKTPKDHDAWFANDDCGKYLRTEKKDGKTWHVLADMDGPGCVVRIWSANPKGTVRVYIDKDDKPAIEESFPDLLSGKVKPFASPIAGVRSQGCNLHFPIPYQKHCKVATSEGGQYYHVNYRTYSKGTDIVSYSKDEVDKNKTLVDQIRKSLDQINKNGLELDLTGANKTPFDSDKGEIDVKLEGPQVIERFELKVEGLKGKELETYLREAVLRISWDGSSSPSVWSPLGDFFGHAPGFRKYHSVPMGIINDQVAYCQYQMPFAKSAKIEIINEGKLIPKISGAIYSRKDDQAGKKLYFHAQWKGKNHVKSRPFLDWCALKGEGQGRFVGLALYIRNPVGNWWGEGDEKIYVDCEDFPSTFGTGTEDYFGYAWCSPALFTHAYHNQTRCDGPGNKGFSSVNRFHFIDDIPFHKSFQFDLEVWHHRTDVAIGFSTIAYWYAKPGFKGDIEPVPMKERELLEVPQPKKLPGVVEGESLKIIQITGGTADGQAMDTFGEKWSGNCHLWWHGAKKGDVLVLAFDSNADGEKTLSLALTKAPDYGTVRISVNGKILKEEIDLYSANVVPTGELKFQNTAIKKGTNELKVEIVGTNPKANPKSYMFGFDYLRIE